MKQHIIVSITGDTEKDWKDKLQEIEELGITESALFLETYDRKEKERIYQAIAESSLQYIPLVHLRHDMNKSELEFLQKNFNTEYFTCHEENFAQNNLEQWKGFYKNIYLEMNFDNFISEKVHVEKIGGFCIDLAHFKVAMENRTKEFSYVMEREDSKVFACNHLNGWNREKNVDMHTIADLQNFDYLATLPKFIFGNVIALEVTNSIREQLEFKKYLSDFLTK